MIDASFADAQTILCIGAHADDIEIGCGGTIHKWLGEGPNRQIHWVVMSAAGERADEAMTSASRFLDAIRDRRVVIKDFRDSYFPAQYADIKSFIHELATEIDPDVIFTHRLEDRHQDHRLLAELTWNVFRDHLIFEYEIPKYEGDLGHPNVYVPLTRDQCETKVDGIVETFQSQVDRRWLSTDNLWALLRLRGIESNAPEGFAEGLTCRKLRL